MKPKLTAALVALAMMSVSAFAQTDLADFPQMPTDAEAAALAAQGARSGDDQMTCEQISAEMAPYTSQLSAASAPLGADAQAIQDKQKNMKGPGVGSTALGMGLGMASSFIPGMGFLAQVQAMAQAQQMKRQADAAKPLQDKVNADSLTMMQQLAPMMQEPRFQRLMQLGQAKCENTGQ